MKQAVLKIYYTDSYGKLHTDPQGKFFYLEDKPVYLADMTPAKWWRNYGGYSISKQIIEAFQALKLRPRIIYRLKDKGTLYEATATKFKKKGILVAYGSHQQYVLPIKEWKAKQAVLNDPHQLPVLNVSDWIKTKEDEFYDDSNVRALKLESDAHTELHRKLVEKNTREMLIDDSVRKRLAEDFRARFK